MPRSRKIVLPASVIIRPAENDIMQFGSPAYADSDSGDAIFYHTGILAPSYDPNFLNLTPSEPNFIVAIHDENGAVLYDATTPEHDSDSDSSDVAANTAAALANVEPAGVNNAIGAEPASLNDRALARAAASRAVAAFYAGRSLPFKAAADLKRKSPINFALNRDPSARSAALLAAILTYCTVEPGTMQFVRGSGRVPRRLIDPSYSGDDTLAAGPESGGLSNCIPDRITYVSGALAGPGCENAIFAINANAAIANMRAHNEKQSDGEHLFSAAIALCELLAQPVASTGSAPNDSGATVAPE